MFSYRSSVPAARPGQYRVEVAFTDASTNLQGVDEPDFLEALGRVEDACGVGFARMHQVHGDVVHLAAAATAHGDPAPPVADALVTDRAGVGLMVRVADCVPVLLADSTAGVVAAVHSGRPGTAADVVTRTVEQMRELGATDLVAWVGPHVCGRCYEVPERMRAEVDRLVPGTAASTDRGTPSLDLTAGVLGQLARSGVRVEHVGGCTMEDPTLPSHRRDGAAAGRMAGLVWFG